MNKKQDDLLRSANRRVASAAEWAKESKLLNVAAELRQASKEISKTLTMSKK